MAGKENLRMKYALVTPVYNESQFIAEMIASVMKQEPRPARWVIVDDGSTDNTWDIIQYMNPFGIIESVRLPAKEERAPGGEAAIAHAFSRLNFSDFNFIARFDADIVLDDGYIAGILREFEKNPRLGIAGGELYGEPQPSDHVRGALKIYRRECLEAVYPLSPEIGWDTLDETRAWIHGWETRNFPDYRARHCRPCGSGISSLSNFWQRGKAEYLNWSDPLFVFLKSFKHIPPQGLVYLASFIYCYLSKTPRFPDVRIRQYRRRYQRQRMFLRN